MTFCVLLHHVTIYRHATFNSCWKYPQSNAVHSLPKYFIVLSVVYSFSRSLRFLSSHSSLLVLFIFQVSSILISIQIYRNTPPTRKTNVHHSLRNEKKTHVIALEQHYMERRARHFNIDIAWQVDYFI